MLDAYGFTRAIAANPGRFGFTTYAIPACTVPDSFVCTSSTLIAPGANQTYFFADAVHPSTGGQRAFADYVLSVLNAPDTAANVGRALAGEADAERFVARFALNGAMAGSGGLFGGLTGGTSEDADAVGALAGVTWRVGDGGAFGLLASYDTGGGDLPSVTFDRDTLRVSVFGAVNVGERLTLSGRLTGAYISLGDLSRSFQINQATVKEAGDTEARGYAAAIGAAYDFGGSGAISHGPFAEIAYQSLDVDAYVERGASPFALEFGEQQVRRTEGEIGYQIKRDGDGFAPYGRVSYVDTLDSDAGSISVSLVNTPGWWSADLEDDEEDGFARVEAGFSMPAFSGARLLVSAAGDLRDENESARLFVGLTKGF